MKVIKNSTKSVKLITKSAVYLCFIYSDLILPESDGVLKVLDGGVLHLLPALAGDGGAVGDHVLVQSALPGQSSSRHP